MCGIILCGSQDQNHLKHRDDRWDSFRLAHLLRLGILPEEYIYPKQERPIRDMLKKLFACPHLVSIAWRQIQTIQFLGE